MAALLVHDSHCLFPYRILDYCNEVGIISGLYCSYATLDLQIAHCNGYLCKTKTKDAATKDAVQNPIRINKQVKGLQDF